MVMVREGAPTTTIHFHVDNLAMAAAIRSGRNPTMRHLHRTHGIHISWMYDQCMSDQIQVRYVTTTLMAADIYTKAFQDAVKWNNLCEHINIVEQSELKKPHIHALHNLLLTESIIVTGKKIANLNMMPDDYHDWDYACGWHQRENMHYMVVREPKVVSHL